MSNVVCYFGLEDAVVTESVKTQNSLSGNTRKSSVEVWFSLLLK